MPTTAKPNRPHPPIGHNAVPDNDQPPTIHLDQFLKAHGLVGTGGQAKLVIQGGEVLVNGERETRRRRQLRHGDLVFFDGEEFPVEFADE